MHVVAERNVHVAAVELTRQAAAVEWRDCVSAVGQSVGQYHCVV